MKKIDIAKYSPAMLHARLLEFIKSVLEHKIYYSQRMEICSCDTITVATIVIY
jgi:hypothetical protein